MHISIYVPYIFFDNLLIIDYKICIIVLDAVDLLLWSDDLREKIFLSPTCLKAS
jgi:hypothetical protein